MKLFAGIAQRVEHLISNQEVGSQRSGRFESALPAPNQTGARMTRSCAEVVR